MPWFNRLKRCPFMAKIIPRTVTTNAMPTTTSARAIPAIDACVRWRMLGRAAAVFIVPRKPALRMPSGNIPLAGAFPVLCGANRISQG